MNNRLDQLLGQCDYRSHIQPILLRALFEELSPDLQEQLTVEYPMPDVQTCIDLAFPKAKIAIYCDGFGPHTKADAFSRDRYQSRELQLQGWRVLRFSQEDIEVHVNNAVNTILRALDPKPPSYSNREMQGDNDRAISDCTKAIELDPNSAYAYYYRALAYYRKGDFYSAIADFTKAIARNPDHAKAYYNRGLVYYKKGNRTRSIADCTKAKSLKNTPRH